MSLLNKLREKLANVKAPKKLIAGLVMAGVLSLSGCNVNTPSNNVDPNNPDTTITNPSDGDTTDPTDPNTSTDPDTTEQHSQIFYDVLNSSYYNNLYEENKTSSDRIWAENACAPIPFSFLEQMGYDTDAIKNGDIECESTSYIKDDETNKLYVTIRVENSTNFKHYTCYVLTYPINNLEYSDLTYLANNSLIQSSFYIQELSYQKTPTIESTASLTINAFNGIVEKFNSTSTLSSDLYGDIKLTIDFLGCSIEENTLELTVRPNSLSNTLSKNVLIRSALMKPSTIGFNVSTNNGIYTEPESKLSFVNSEMLSNYKNNPTSVTYFDIQGKLMAPCLYNTTNTK